MKDSVVRGCLLQLLYEHRSEGSIPFGGLEQAMPPPGGISHGDWLQAVAQLSEYCLIDWSPLEDKSGMGLLSGFARINEFGVKVLQGGVEPPIEIFKHFTHFDQLLPLPVNGSSAFLFFSGHTHQRQSSAVALHKALQP